MAVPALRGLRRVPTGRGRDGRRGRCKDALHVALVVEVALAPLLGGHVERRLRRRSPVLVRLASRLEERVAVVDGGRAAFLSLRR